MLSMAEPRESDWLAKTMSRVMMSDTGVSKLALLSSTTLRA